MCRELINICIITLEGLAFVQSDYNIFPPQCLVCSNVKPSIVVACPGHRDNPLDGRDRTRGRKPHHDLRGVAHGNGIFPIEFAVSKFIAAWQITWRVMCVHRVLGSCLLIFIAQEAIRQNLK